MIIRFKRRTQNQILVWVLIMGPFLIAPLTQLLRMPSAIKYVLDICWLLVLANMISSAGKRKKINKMAYQLQNWVLMFAIFTMINYIVNYQSIFYYLWGLRNNFRGYVLFFAVVYYLKCEDVDKILKIFDKIFWINAVIMLFQFGILGYEQDYLGGVFGVEKGCNGYVNIFFCLIMIITYMQYIGGEVTIKKLLLELTVMLILAAMAEIKFFYVEFIIILAVASLVTKFSWKKLLIIVGAIIALIIGYKVFLTIFPKIELSFDVLYDYASSDRGYTSHGDLNRLNFLNTIDRQFLSTWNKRLFGLGLGNCDYAAGIDFLTTAFARKYSDLLHYSWMSTTFMYLENGWLGLIFFFGFFVLVCIKSKKMLKESNVNKKICAIALLSGIVAIVNGFYNISMRIEACYMVYFLMAIPWCKKEGEDSGI